MLHWNLLLLIRAQCIVEHRVSNEISIVIQSHEGSQTCIQFSHEESTAIDTSTIIVIVAFFGRFYRFKISSISLHHNLRLTCVHGTRRVEFDALKSIRKFVFVYSIWLKKKMKELHTIDAKHIGFSNEKISFHKQLNRQRDIMCWWWSANQIMNYFQSNPQKLHMSSLRLNETRHKTLMRRKVWLMFTLKLEEARAQQWPNRIKCIVATEIFFNALSDYISKNSKIQTKKNLI